MNPNELRKQAKALLDAADGIEAKAKEESRDLTDDERSTIDDNIKSAEDAVSKAEQIEADETAAAERAIRRADLTTRANAITQRRIVPQQRPAAEARTQFENISEFMHAAVFNPNDQRLSWVEPGATQTMGTGSAGGFALPPQFRSEIMQASPQQAIVRPRAMVIEPGNPPDGAVTIPALDQATTNMHGGASVSWIEEGAAKPETSVTLRQITLEPKEVAAHVPITDKLLRNWASANALITEKLRFAVISAEETAFMTGSGVGKPLGITVAAGGYHVNRAGSNAVAYADLVNMEARIFDDGSELVWIISRSVLPELRTMEDSEGHLIWNENARVGGVPSLLGYPTLVNTRSPALGSDGDVCLVNLRHYLIKDGSGPLVEVGHANADFTNNIRRIKITFNVDGQPENLGYLKEDNGYQVSPFVVLDASS